MSMFLDTENKLHNDPGATGLECPHCRNNAHMTLLSSPDFRTLSKTHSEEVGAAYQCDACQAPVFLKFRVKSFKPERINFYPVAHEVERPAEKYQFNYLPPAVSGPFQDALGCYRHGLINAFAAMCQHTAQAIFADLDQSSRMKIFDMMDDVQKMAEIDDRQFDTIRKIVLEHTTENTEMLNRQEAAILLEAMKDILYQCYVRKARFRQALKMRQFFAEQAGTPVTTKTPTIETESS
ncbi:MAG: hypothetical protein ACR2P6_00715 [Gammaproteobacteria bacterium]